MFPDLFRSLPSDATPAPPVQTSNATVKPEPISEPDDDLPPVGYSNTWWIA